MTDFTLVRSRGKDKTLTLSSPSPSCSELYITLHVIYSNYTMAGKVIMGSELTGREGTASADTSVIKALLSGEMCIYTQLITVSNWEEGFKTGQLASPLSTLEVASDKTICVSTGNKSKFVCRA